MNKKSDTNKKIAGIGLFLLMLSGCVTEAGLSSLTQKANEKKLLQTSIAAGMEYIRAGQSDDAYRHLSRALEIDSKSAQAHHGMALLYRLTKDHELEEKHFKLSIRYDPRIPEVRNNYATFLYKEGRYKDALYQLKKASKDPSYGKRDLALENIGRCYLKEEDVKEAEKAFRGALQINDNLPRSHLELAQIHFDRGELKEANRHLKKYGELARHTPRSLWLGIRIQRVLGDKNALASYELALKNLYPKSEEYRLFQQPK